MNTYYFIIFEHSTLRKCTRVLPTHLSNLHLNPGSRSRAATASMQGNVECNTAKTEDEFDGFARRAIEQRFLPRQQLFAGGY
jgi:hypothetical protein